MVLILGGYAQGRLAYAKKKYHLTDEEICDAAVQPWRGERAIYHAEYLTLAQVRAFLPELTDHIMISQEVGSGLIPLTRAERDRREEIGQLNQLLARHAHTVIEVLCGLERVLKSS